MQFAQIRDQVEITSETAGPIDASGLIGTWINSNPDTTGIARMMMSEAGNKLTLQTFAIGPDDLIDWGTTDVTVVGSSAASRAGAGFICVYDFGFAETRLQGMIMKGLLVLAQLHSFKDDSKRLGYFVREYYALDHVRF
jgi:hypothetical protein